MKNIFEELNIPTDSEEYNYFLFGGCESTVDGLPNGQLIFHHSVDGEFDHVEVVDVK